MRCWVDRALDGAFLKTHARVFYSSQLGTINAEELQMSVTTLVPVRYERIDVLGDRISDGKFASPGWQRHEGARTYEFRACVDQDDGKDL